MGPGRVRARSSMRFWSCDCVIKYGKNLKISTIASRLNHNGGRSAPRAGSLRGVQHNLRSVALLRLQDGALLQRQICQTAHWSDHKADCKAFRAEADSSASAALSGAARMRRGERYLIKKRWAKAEAEFRKVRSIRTTRTSN